MYNNQNYPSFRVTGIVLGCLVLLFTATLLSIELGRLYSGSNNRGRNDSNETFQYSIFPDTVIGYNGNIINPKLENRWMWPWSTATLLFSLLFFTTGVIGIISSQRQNYSSILTFFICSLLSLCLLIFLIATYSTIIAGWKNIYGTNEGDSISSFVRIDKNLSSASLAVSCGLFIILLTSLILTGRTINACTRKEIPRVNNAYERVIG
ncbi:unnamed protein product [Rotaria sp. Silwood2]|nr:unnamed protein product [Rotaria sp. Silwood2]CAF2564145.1 unnamed protein product [Rotaria sp. Silwood2]CAF2968482.1 unnamed protein product [Rotaria sp. Silwood2]CAF4002950.1 unnamed protein product [Rotaria sp. Silwood2]CAF4034485.1 unnamed protein product [Rotaria sp. Silwood2]